MYDRVLDMDSSQRPTYGEQQGSIYDGHFCGTRLFTPCSGFNQFCDVERNVHSADGWRAELWPEVGDGVTG